MLRPTPTRVHAAGPAGEPRIPTRWEANRLCARLCCCESGWRTSGGQPGYRQAMPGRRSVTVCCRSASRRRSTGACCAGKRFVVNSSSAQSMAARAVQARAWLRCILRRRCGGPERAARGLLRCAFRACATQGGATASAASELPVSRSQRNAATGGRAARLKGSRHRASGYRAAGRAPFRAAEGRYADCRCPRCHCRRDIWWRIG
jgi:hypothetical protein